MTIKQALANFCTDLDIDTGTLERYLSYHGIEAVLKTELTQLRGSAKDNGLAFDDAYTQLQAAKEERDVLSKALDDLNAVCLEQQHRLEILVEEWTIFGNETQRQDAEVLLRTIKS